MFYWHGLPYFSFTPLFDDETLYTFMHISNDVKERLNYEDIDTNAKAAAAYVKAMGTDLPVLELDLSRAAYREVNYPRWKTWKRGR